MSVYENPFFPEWLSPEVKSRPQPCITSVDLQVYLRKKVLPRKSRMEIRCFLKESELSSSQPTMLYLLFYAARPLKYILTNLKFIGFE